MSDSPFVDRMREAMTAAGYTQVQLATLLGINQSAVSNIFKGKRHLKLNEAEIIGKFLGLASSQPEIKIQFVPIIGMSSAGNWREAIHLPSGQMPIPPNIASKDAFAVEVRGDSMDLLIPDGGYVVVDPAKTELFNGKSYLLQNDEGETTVKAYRSDPARFEPMSTNPEHTPIVIGEQRFKVLGRVVWRGAPA